VESRPSFSSRGSGTTSPPTLDVEADAGVPTRSLTLPQRGSWTTSPPALDVEVDAGEPARSLTLPQLRRPRAGPLPSGEQRSAFDTCTVRSWFIEMDTDNSGVVTKEEFMNFLRDRPLLQNAFWEGVQGIKPELYFSQTPRSAQRSAQALGIKRVLKLFREIDADNSGSLEWEEFLEFFHRTGLLLEYAIVNNPRDRMAEMLGKQHHHRQLWAKWQKAGVDAGAVQTGLSAELQVENQQARSQFLLEQKRQQLQSQWLSSAKHCAELADRVCDAFRSSDASNCSIESIQLKPLKAKPLVCLEGLVRAPPKLAPLSPAKPRTAKSTPRGCPSPRKTPRRARCA